MNQSTHDIGKRGEDIACSHLEKRGFTITARNLHIGHDEIDIVANDGEGIVFVEVKTRTAASSFGRPSNAVDTQKRTRLIRAAEEYLRHSAKKCPIRIDVVEVVFPKIHRDTPINISRLLPTEVKYIKGAVRSK